MNSECWKHITASNHYLLSSLNKYTNFNEKSCLQIHQLDDVQIVRRRKRRPRAAPPHCQSLDSARPSKRSGWRYPSAIDWFTFFWNETMIERFLFDSLVIVTLESIEFCCGSKSWRNPAWLLKEMVSVRGSTIGSFITEPIMVRQRINKKIPRKRNEME